MRNRDYWMQRGVIPRWQYFGVYVAILICIALGFWLNSEQTATVQRSRVESLRIQCQQQNAQHQRILAELRYDFGVIPEQRAKRFADALAPLHNCTMRARRLTTLK